MEIYFLRLILLVRLIFMIQLQKKWSGKLMQKKFLKRQGKILSVLRREDGIGQKELAEQLQIRPASLSELLDKMQKSGWIQRRVNEKDRRKINIFLTEDGKGISQQMIEAAGYGEYCFWRIERG